MPISEVFNEDNMIGMAKPKKEVQTPEERRRRKAQRARKRYNENRDIERAKQNERRNKNRGEYNRKRNEYRTKNSAGIYDVIKQSASKRHLEIGVTKAEFVAWYEAQARICVYCLRSEEDVNRDIDIIQNIAKRLSIDRKDNNKGYLKGNMALACRRCNTIKGNYFSYEEMKLIGKIIQKKHACK